MNGERMAAVVRQVQKGILTAREALARASEAERVVLLALLSDELEGEE